MNLQGRIEKFNVPEIFKTIISGRGSGTLGVNRDDQAVIIYFKDGQVTYAYAPSQPRRIGERFVAKGIINNKTLEESLIRQKRTGGEKRLGVILIEGEFVNKQQLESTLTEQITDVIYSVMSWDRGLFKFYEDKFPTREEITLSLSTEHLVEEGTRRLDELNRLKLKLPDFSTCLIMKPLFGKPDIELKLSADDWNVLVMCDGRNSIGKIVSDACNDSVGSIKSLIRLFYKGLIEPANRSSDWISDANLTELEVKIDNLSIMLEEFLKKG